jgi:hypothetical protein
MQCGASRRNIDEMNISGFNFSGQNLTAVDLRGFLISKVNFENSDLSGADLRGVDFGQSNCVCARFMGADFRGASLAFGYFNNSDFSGADFRGAKLEGGLCSECVFAGADMRGVRFGSEHYNSDFRGADLRGAVVQPGCEFEKLNCDIRNALTTPPHIDSGSGNKRVLPRIRPRQQMNVFDRASGTQLGVIADLSLEGLKIICVIAIKVQQIIQLDIVPEQGTQDNTISVDARTIWCTPQQDTAWFSAGLKIERISEKHRGIIQAIIKEHQIET